MSQNNNNNNGCFIELEDLTLPFTSEDFFTDKDLDMIFGRTPLPKELHIKSDKVLWNNWAGTSQLQDDGSAGTKLHDSTDDHWDEVGKLHDLQHFNGTATITNTELKRQVQEFLWDTFHEDFLYPIWDTPYGGHTPPITILCFNKTSMWHSEGPLPIPDVIPKEGQETLRQIRSPAVCNFRLLGDIHGSRLEFSDAKQKLIDAEEFCQQKFFSRYIRDLTSRFREPDSEFAYQPPVTKIPQSVAVRNRQLHQQPPMLFNGLLVSPTTSYILDVDYWRNQMIPNTGYDGMHKSYIVNLSKWHRVLTNDTPRVTFRVHANSNKMNWDKIQDLVNTGKLIH